MHLPTQALPFQLSAPTCFSLPSLPSPSLVTVCGNGTVNMGAVKGAVDEFAAAHGLTITVTL